MRLAHKRKVQMKLQKHLKATVAKEKVTPNKKPQAEKKNHSHRYRKESHRSESSRY